MQRNLGGCLSAPSRSQVQSTANRVILRISLAGWRQLGTLMILCLLLGCGVAHAQGVNSASLAGTVLDSSGAAIRGAKVTVTNGATGSEWNAISDDAGRYNLLGLPPGQYKVSVGGARARGTMVSVDGADAVDNSINAIRSTLSQEGIQEFQLILSNYNAEYGRASGGVINIVSKSGTNEFHGNAFGYFRNKAFQARNAFSGQVDPVTGNLDPIKQAYTRTQSGFTFGGPLKKDKTFAFLSYEYTQREESGFSSIGINKFSMVPVTLPPAAGGLTVQLTPDQAKAVNSLFAAAAATSNPNLAKLAASYAVFMGSASSVALNGLDYGALVTTLSGGSITPVNPVPVPGGVLFQEFPLPGSCPSATTVNSLIVSGVAAFGPSC